MTTAPPEGDDIRSTMLARKNLNTSHQALAHTGRLSTANTKHSPFGANPMSKFKNNWDSTSNYASNATQS